MTSTRADAAVFGAGRSATEGVPLAIIGSDPDSGDLLFNNGGSNQWNGGLSLQYSMRYLSAQAKGLGLPEFVNRLTPVAEPAWAHAYLERAIPPVGSTVATAPAEIRLFFTGRIEPSLSRIAVRDATGARVKTGVPRLAPEDDRQLMVGLSPLPSGVYTVECHVATGDTHKTEGRYAFTVGR